MKLLEKYKIRPYSIECGTESQHIGFRLRERFLRMEDFRSGKMSPMAFHSFLNESQDALAPEMDKARDGNWQNGVPPWIGNKPSDFWDGLKLTYHLDIDPKNKASRYGFILWVAASVTDEKEIDEIETEVSKAKNECYKDNYWDSRGLL